MSAPRRCRRRRAGGAGGFSLIEMLVALGLAGLVVAGAFQLHGTFARESRRQDEVGDLQQTLRIVMTLLERNIRAAGAGEQAGALRLLGCAQPVDLYTFQYFNSNAFPPTAGSFDSTVGDADNDPDWFRVVLPIATSNLAVGENANKLSVRGDLTGWQPGDLISVFRPGSMTTPISCVREITSVDPGAQEVAHLSPGTTFPCANPVTETCAPASTTCCPLNLVTATSPTPVRRYRDELVFRVIPTPSGSRDAPKLVMMQVPIGQYGGGRWQVVAESIEDMQIALIGKNGSVCNSVDNPALCNPSLASAVRITLVARTNNTRTTASQVGGFEDRPSSASGDNFIRRSVTSEIQLRN